MAQHVVRTLFLTRNDSLDHAVSSLLPQAMDGHPVVIRRSDGLHLAMAVELVISAPVNPPGWVLTHQVSCVLCQHDYRHGVVGYNVVGSVVVGLCRACVARLASTVEDGYSLGGVR